MKQTILNKISLAVFCALFGTNAARAFITSNDGTIYNFEKLSTINHSGVTKTMEGSSVCYLLEGNDTIAGNDEFVIDKGIIVKFADQAQLVILGKADLRATEESPTLLTTIGKEMGNGILLHNETGAMMSWLTFEYIGVSSMSSGSVCADYCQFKQHNGTTAAALFFISAGQMATISNCKFEYCVNAAIGSAANAPQSMTINNCVFNQNSTNNSNKPQVNITAAEIVIDHCDVLGDSTSTTINNMVGGIGISNFMSYENKIRIANSRIMHNRYGIGTVGPTNIIVESNQICHNNHEANPMNGGSGISFYDPYGQTTALVAKNLIEDNIWGITIIGCKDVNVGKPTNSDVPSPGMNVFKNNGFNNQPYDLYNNSKLTVYAQNNTWGVEEQTAEMIETVIYHHYDDSSLGEVVFMSAYDESTPVKKPRKSKGDNNVYDLRGHKHNNIDNKHNILIVNGKKVVR